MVINTKPVDGLQPIQALSMQTDIIVVMDVLSGLQITLSDLIGMNFK